MASGARGVGDEGGGSRGKGNSEQKRVASGERPDTETPRAGESKVQKVMSEELTVLFKVTSQGRGDTGFKALHPLKVTSSLESKLG